MARKLTPKQELFVEEYMKDLNAAGAARRAGYSEKMADKIGHQLLGKTRVAEAIETARKDISKRNNLTVDMVVNELRKVAFADMRNLMTWGPEGVKMKDSSSISPDAAAAVSEVSKTITECGGTVRLKTADKIKALELLGKHLGAFKEKDTSAGMNVILTDEKSLVYQAVLEQVRRTSRNVRSGEDDPGE